MNSCSPCIFQVGGHFVPFMTSAAVRPCNPLRAKCITADLCTAMCRPTFKNDALAMIRLSRFTQNHKMVLILRFP